MAPPPFDVHHPVDAYVKVDDVAAANGNPFVTTVYKLNEDQINGSHAIIRLIIVVFGVADMNEHRRTSQADAMSSSWAQRTFTSPAPMRIRLLNVGRQSS